MAIAADEPKYALDENGVPIKPGYRKPFTSETAKAASDKAKIAIAAKYFNVLQPAQGKTLSQPALTAKLNSVRRAFRRHIAASTASNKGSDALFHARAARECLSIEQELLGVSKPSKRGSKPHLQSLSPVAISPIQSIAPVAKNASGVKVEPSVSPVSPQVAAIGPASSTVQATTEQATTVTPDSDVPF